MEGNPPQTPMETSRWSRDESNDEEIDRSKSPDEFGDTLRQNPFGNLLSEDKMENSDGAKDEDDEPQTFGGKRKPPPSKVDVKERNRTHARNSRLRKKAHVEKLQRTALILSCKNEQMERQQVERMAATLDIQATERAMVQRLLYYRVQGCIVPGYWHRILAEDFTFTLPVTPYRYFNPGEISRNGRVLYGVEGIIRDTASLAQLFLSVGPRHHRGSFKPAISMEIDLDSVAQERNILWCRWTMRSTDAVANGALAELESDGMLQACFSTDHKIQSVEFLFDVLSFTFSLSRALGRSFDVVPNTVEMAAEMCAPPKGKRDASKKAAVNTPSEGQDEHTAVNGSKKPDANDGASAATGAFERDAEAPRAKREDMPATKVEGHVAGQENTTTTGAKVAASAASSASSSSSTDSEGAAEACLIASAFPPFVIQDVNEAWTDLFGFSVKEVRGGTLNMVHGPATDAHAVQRLMDDLRLHLPSSMLVLNYRKGGETFWNYLRMYPLSSTGHETILSDASWGRVTHYLGIFEPCFASSTSTTFMQPSLEATRDMVSEHPYVAPHKPVPPIAAPLSPHILGGVHSTGARELQMLQHSVEKILHKGPSLRARSQIPRSQVPPRPQGLRTPGPWGGGLTEHFSQHDRPDHLLSGQHPMRHHPPSHRQSMSLQQGHSQPHLRHYSGHIPPTGPQHHLEHSHLTQPTLHAHPHLITPHLPQHLEENQNC